MVPTQDHWQIRHWAQAQGALPARVHRRSFDGEPSILTFVFGVVPEAAPEILLISWEMFFAQFDLLKLSIAFDDASHQFAIVKVASPSAAYPMH